MVAIDIHANTIEKTEVRFFPKSEKCQEFSTLRISLSHYGDKGTIQIFVHENSLDQLLEFSKQIQKQILQYQATFYKTELDVHNGAR